MVLLSNQDKTILEKQIFSIVNSSFRHCVTIPYERFLPWYLDGNSNTLRRCVQENGSL